MSTSSIPMYEQIQNELMEQIQSGFFSPETAFPAKKSWPNATTSAGSRR